MLTLDVNKTGITLFSVVGRIKANMVNVMKGILVECDPAMKQFLLHLDETEAFGRKFVIQDLDETHIFISADILPVLRDRIDDLMDKLSFPLIEK